MLTTKQQQVLLDFQQSKLINSRNEHSTSEEIQLEQNGRFNKEQIT